MARPRIRRPLLALIVLIVLLVVGYTVRAVNEHRHSSAPAPLVSTAAGWAGNGSAG